MTKVFHFSNVIVFLFFFSPFLFSQDSDVKKESSVVDQLIDSLWNVRDNDQRLLVANELHRLAISEKSALAAINADQGIGEFFYFKNQLDSAIYYYKKAEISAIKGDEQVELGHILTSLGSLYQSKGDMDNSISTFEDGMKVWETIGDSSKLNGYILRYATALSQFDRMNEAMKMYMNSLELSEKINDEAFVAHNLAGMSTIHKKQKNLPKAIELSQNALEIYRRLDGQWALISQLNNMGILYKDIGNYQKAEESYAEGLNLSIENNLEQLTLSFYQNLGILDNLKGDPKSAIENCTKALKTNSGSRRPIELSDALNELAKAHLKLGNYTVARDSINSSIKYAQIAHSLEKEHQAWETKYKILKKMGDSSGSLASLEMYQILNDSIFLHEKTAEIDRLQTEYETTKKEQEIAHLETEAQLDSERKKWLRNGIIGISLAAIGFILSLIIKRRKDIQLHRAEKELQKSENIRLKDKLDFKQRELTSQALHLAQKNELLMSLKEDLKKLKNSGSVDGITQLSHKIKFDEQIDNNWDQFTKAFTETKSEFFKKLSTKHEGVGKSDLRLAALLSMNLASKEIASILNISDEGVKKARYRLRKKLDLNSDENLNGYLASL